MNRVETANHLKAFDVGLYLNKRLKYYIKPSESSILAHIKTYSKLTPINLKSFYLAKGVRSIMAKDVS